MSGARSTLFRAETDGSPTRESPLDNIQELDLVQTLVTSTAQDLFLRSMGAANTQTLLEAIQAERQRRVELEAARAAAEAASSS